MISRLRIAPLIGCVLTTACYSLDSGPQDVESVAETAQPASKGPQGVVWKDATGKVAERTFSEALAPPSNPGTVFRYIDANGHVWTLDRESGTLLTASGTDRLYYASNDCSGQAFGNLAALPRYTIGLVNGTGIYVRADAAVYTPIRICSWWYYGSCIPMDCLDTGLLPVDKLPDLAPPDLQLVGPLHPEMP